MTKQVSDVQIVKKEFAQRPLDFVADHLSTCE